MKFDIGKFYRSLILPFVLYGCETWTHTLREEHSLRMFENMVLTKIFEPNRDEVSRGWRKLHNSVICTINQILGERG
jgi:hypothetical protein